MYDTTWSSLRHHTTPEWLREAKFGIYTHWGIYSVHGRGANTTWYSYGLYQGDENQLNYHKEHFGDLKDFGYTDFIPMFTAEKFDADEWAEIFFDAGAKFAGPVAEHHDGFSMWNTKHNTMNSYRMGPKRDVVGELSEAIRKKGMKYMVALHHAENYSFLKKVPGTDSMKPEFEEMFSKEGVWTREKFNHVWYAKLIELIDLYSPDLMWFDFGLRDIPDRYKRSYLSYYYNHALKNNKDVIVAYKNRDLVAEGGLLDLELGRFDDVMDFDWITDTTIDSRDAWGYMHGATYKSSEELIQYLVENVSKNGYLLLNVGPKPDGTFPDEARPILHDMGQWLRVNGEGIYGSVPWYEAKEGPAKLEKSGPITDYESKIKYTQEDIRYTAKDNAIYAFIMARPSHKVTLNYILPHLSEGELESVSLLGSDTPLQYQTDGKQLHVFMPDQMPEEPIYTLKILRRELLPV